MADFLDLLPLFGGEDEATIRDRWDTWANEGLALSDPSRVDTREGSIFQTLTEPGVREAARIYDRMGTEVVAASSPLYAFLTYLDDQAESRGMERHAAALADGTVTFSGTPGTGIPSGTAVEVEPSDPDADFISFQTVDAAVVGGGGTVDVAVRAVLSGSDGNVTGGAITILATPVSGLDSVTNVDPTSGGTDVETDEDLRDRIIESFQVAVPGNQLYYKQIAGNWAGVGRATVIPLYAGPDTVLVIITTADGGPVSQAAIDALQEFLDPATFSNQLDGPISVGATVITVDSTVGAHEAPSYIEIGEDAIHYTGMTGTTFTGCSNVLASHLDNAPVIQRQGGAGEAPIGAYVKVKTATELGVVITATVEFDYGYSLDGFGGTGALQDVITENAREYVEAQPSGGVIYYSKVIGAIAGVEGVKNVTALVVNGGTTDISISFAPPQSPILALTLTAAP